MHGTALPSAEFVARKYRHWLCFTRSVERMDARVGRDRSQFVEHAREYRRAASKDATQAAEVGAA